MTAGLIAVLVKPVTATVGRGVGAVVATWQTWVLLAVGVAAFLLLQNALQAGRLIASQPGITLAIPLVAATWGVEIFHEQVRTGWWSLGAGVGAALLAAGAVLLSSSPLLAGHQEAPTAVTSRPAGSPRPNPVPLADATGGPSRVPRVLHGPIALSVALVTHNGRFLGRGGVHRPARGLAASPSA